VQGNPGLVQHPEQLMPVGPQTLQSLVEGRITGFGATKLICVAWGLCLKESGWLS
jgi:hypothetical protein